LRELVTSIEANRQHRNLSSAIRLFVLNHYKSLLGERARSSGAGRLAVSDDFEHQESSTDQPNHPLRQATA